ncbi:hypothetical protein M2132_002161 [Dysgonomonas sp. PH5-45]|uniref:DUF4292 domain-containing protein n=1 Tax=unclassified Dysgonomonas TaxID=2630389 RepID=UPI002475A7AC|nr:MULTISPECIES: DUF4292 domain-containing protein [unclassified Dysgonomonas]MDH6355814.1 hypothetical protein [Dysgonomonas sp. PH5-45]MDH6388719.1 hypothetical protein [Dysgonomonas sp. PH5-37]
MNILNRKYFFRIAVIASCLVFLAGCKSSKETFKTTKTLVRKSHTEILRDVQTHELKYRTINGKISVEVAKIGAKNGQKIGGIIKIDRNKAMQISFRVLGIEGFRMTLTPDSVFVIDRLKKMYAAESIKTISDKFNFNYYNLQALFTNSLFLPGKAEVTEKDFNLFLSDTSSDTHLLKVKDDNNILYNFAIDGNDHIASTLIFQPTTKRTVQWSYANFVVNGKYVYPTQMISKIEVDKTRLDVGISLSKMEFDKKVNIDWSVPKKYTQSTISDIIKAHL